MEEKPVFTDNINESPEKTQEESQEQMSYQETPSQEQVTEEPMPEKESGIIGFIKGIFQ